MPHVRVWHSWPSVFWVAPWYSSSRMDPHKTLQRSQHFLYSLRILMIMDRFLFFSATTACFIVSARAASSCYYPDGVTIDPTHVPCNSTIGTSSCCDPLDSCTTSGLCLGRTGFNYRGSCTDKTWTSFNCPSSCHASTTI
jgi:hypothetical protein